MSTTSVCIVEMSLRASYLIEIECLGYIESKYLAPLLRCPVLEIENTRCCGGGCLLCMPTIDKWEIYHFAQVKKKKIKRTYNQDIIDMFMPYIELKLEQYGEMDDDSNEDEEDEEDVAEIDSDYNEQYSHESSCNDSRIHDIDSCQTNSREEENINTCAIYSSDPYIEYTYYYDFSKDLYDNNKRVNNDNDYKDSNKKVKYE